MNISGSAAGEMEAEFGVKTAMVEAEREIDRTVAYSEGKMAQQGRKWVGFIESFERKVQKAQQKAEINVMATLRQLYGQISSMVRTLGRVFGLGKNAIYQLFEGMITGLVSLVATAQQAAATWAGVPVIGPVIAGLMLVNAGMSFAMQISTGITQAMTKDSMDKTGEAIDGWSA